MFSYEEKSPLSNVNHSTQCPRYSRCSQFDGVSHRTFLYLHVLRSGAEYHLFLYLQNQAQCLVLKNIYWMEMKKGLQYMKITILRYGVIFAMIVEEKVLTSQIHFLYSIVGWMLYKCYILFGLYKKYVEDIEVFVFSYEQSEKF